MHEMMGTGTMRDYVSVYTTAPDEQVAKEIARALHDNHLIACANIVPGGTSIYRWEGEVQEEGEVFVFMKTRRDLAPLVVREIESRHPYETPAALVFDLLGGSPAFLEWIRAETHSIPVGERT